MPQTKQRPASCESWTITYQGLRVIIAERDIVNDPLSARPNGTLTYRLRGRSAADGGAISSSCRRTSRKFCTSSSSAATNRSPGAQTGVGDTATLTVGAGALTSRWRSSGPGPWVFFSAC
jgi:hypothetical protein